MILYIQPMRHRCGSKSPRPWKEPFWRLMLSASCGHEPLRKVQEDPARCRCLRLSCRRYSLQQEAVRRPRRLQIAKHRVALRVRASRAACWRDEALPTGWPIVTAGKSGGTPARLPRGLFQTHKALPSSFCFSQMPFETSAGRPRQVVCLIEAKWVFSQDRLLPTLFCITKEPEMLVRSNRDSECTVS